MIRKLEGLTANDLIEILENYPRDTKVCTPMLGENFPVKQVEECIYYDFENGKRDQEHKGILIKS
ncbi:hypothetical protein [Clostridium beijerinckii]|uniref:hypothetical protein n=1 Tax=Clostridium beijerinckii TaxID=1520 RepID=UPI001ECBF8F5|nr:hypothetical protein [Clostridium beijerinckii]NOV69961.1 hypothetical protein [Clostridium beijerinckii]NOW31132.1 hypothetical protein [Clostridium beijerinckii]NOW86305.1 hypothetical protein [Clostridium beijerinckii]